MLIAVIEGTLLCLVNGVARTPKSYAHQGRLLEHTLILLNCVSFKIGTFLKGKNSLQGEFFPLREVPFGMENHFYHIQVTSLECYYFYYARA